MQKRLSQISRAFKSLIFRFSPQELAPYSFRHRLPGITGPVPPPLSIRGRDAPFKTRVQMSTGVECAARGIRLLRIVHELGVTLHPRRA